ncbi:TniQ family protein [Herbaspirillum sp. GCM10030257]|uniref:TniQ family protein n=1 Tax=Herbaspirillum sp. GCM10030257 TaxID=3273393 RepID=UPI00361B845E
MNLPLSAITWISGSLRPYESMPSIIAKLCHLNKVKPPFMFDYLADFLCRSAARRQSNVRAGTEDKVSGQLFGVRASTLDDHGFPLAVFARILSEPVSIMRTCTYEAIIPKSAARIQEFSPTIGGLRVCPQCLATGYHAVFHQLPWFYRCLVHGTKLKCVLARSDEKTENAGFPAHSDLAMVPALFRAMFGEESSWDCNNIRNWEAPPRGYFVNIDDYVQWIRSLEDTSEDCWLPATSFVDFAGQITSFAQSVSDCLRCLGSLWMSPLQATECLLPSQIFVLPTEHTYSIRPSQARLIQDGTTLFPQQLLRDLPEVEQVSSRITCDDRPWKKLIRSTLVQIERQVATFEAAKERIRSRLSANSIRHHVSGPPLSLRDHSIDLVRKWLPDALGPMSHADGLRELVNNQEFRAKRLYAGNLVRTIPYDLTLLDQWSHLRQYETTIWRPISSLRPLCTDVIYERCLAEIWQRYLSVARRVRAAAEREPAALAPVNTAPIMAYYWRDKHNLCLVVWHRCPDKPPRWESLWMATDAFPPDLISGLNLTKPHHRVEEGSFPPDKTEPSMICWDCLKITLGYTILCCECCTICHAAASGDL